MSVSTDAQTYDATLLLYHVAAFRVPDDEALGGERAAGVAATVEALAEDEGVPVGDVLAAVAEAVAAGMAEVWDGMGAHLIVSLTPLAAELLDVEPDDESRGWRPRGRSRFQRLRETTLEDLELHRADDRPDPRALEPIEYMEPDDVRGYRRDGRPIPRMRELLGSRVAWPLPCHLRRGRTAEQRVSPCSCPVCKGRYLPTTTYCLVCDRSGVDKEMPEVRPEPRKEPPKFMPKGAQAVA